MAITIDTFELPPGLVWANEYAWTGVARAIERSVTGVPVIQTTALTSGRDIVFDGSDGACWITRAQLDALVTLVATDGDSTLTLHDGRNVTVQFNEPAYEVEPLIGYDDVPDDADRWVLRALNLITTGEMQPPDDPEDP